MSNSDHHPPWAPARLGAVAISLMMILCTLPAKTSDVRAGPTPPVWTMSRYMRTVNHTTLGNEGCQQGKEASSDIAVILDFGQPREVGSTYGATLFDPANTFASITAIVSAAEAYLAGFYSCAPAGRHLRLIIGTNNHHDSIDYTTFAHGQAWAKLVMTVNNWIASYPSFALRVDAAGGSDMDLTSNTASATESWADGFAYIGSAFYYDYGDCTLCPYDHVGPSWSAGWSPGAVYYVAWKVGPARPLPQSILVTGSQAAQWGLEELYVVKSLLPMMSFAGANTQWAAFSGGSAYNTPAQGWLQLVTQVHQTIPWSTDFTRAN
jgi:hypothetical protein